MKNQKRIILFALTCIFLFLMIGMIDPAPAAAQTGTYSISLDPVKKDAANNPVWSYPSGESFVIYSTVTVSDVAPPMDNNVITVTFPKKWIADVTAPNAVGVTVTTRHTATDYVFDFTYDRMTGGMIASLPITIRMQNLKTPNGYEMPMTQELRSAAGDLLAAPASHPNPNTANKVTSTAEVKLTYYTRSFREYAGYPDPADITKIDPLKPRAIPIETLFYTNNTASSIGKYCDTGHKVTLTLPAGARLATAAESQYARYWTSSTSAAGVTTVSRVFSCTSYWGNSISEMAPIAFPGFPFSPNQNTYDTEIPWTVDVLDADRNPVPEYQVSSVTKLALIPNPPPPNGSGVRKSLRTGSLYRYYMTPDNMDRETAWDIVNTEPTMTVKPEEPFTIKLYGFRDYSLDQDLYYSGFQLQPIPANFIDPANAVKFKVYGTKGTQKDLLYTSTNAAEAAARITIPPDATGTNSYYTELWLEFDNDVSVTYNPVPAGQSSTLTWTVFTKVKPERWDKNNETVNNQIVSLNGLQYNYTTIYSNTVAVRPDNWRTTPSASSYTYVMIYVYRRSIDSAFAVTPTRMVGLNDAVPIALGLRLAIDPADLFPENLNYYAVMPEGVSPDPNTPVTFCGKAVASEVVYNFLGTGKKALVIRDLQKLLPTCSNVYSAAVNFKQLIGPSTAEGANVVDHYFTWSNNDQVKSNNVYGAINRYMDALDLDQDGNVTEYFEKVPQELVYSPPKQIYTQKWLSTDPGLDKIWFAEGQVAIDMELPYYYRVTINNRSDVSVKTVDVLDVLPYVGDHTVVPDANNLYHARNSEFRVELTGPITSASPKYDFFYSTDTQPADIATLSGSTINWMTQAQVEATSSWGAINLIRIRLKTGEELPSKEVVSFDFPVKTPLNKELTRYSRAFNSGATFAGTAGGGGPIDPANYLEFGSASAAVNWYTVSGIAFSDVNKDGIKQDTEPILINRPVRIVDESGNPVTVNGVPLAGQTDASGAYSFNVYVRGNYQVVFDKDPLEFTQQVASTATVIGSDVNITDGKSPLFNLSPQTRVKTINAGYIYESPTEPRTGTKVWVNGSASNRPDVWLRLYRQAPTGEVEAVPNVAPLKVPAAAPFTVTWPSVAINDPGIRPYTFTVRETDAAGDPLTPLNYTKNETGLTVTNTYVIPKNAEATATKVWDKGPALKPTIWFSLYRNIAGGTAEAVPGADVKTLPDGTTSVSWTGLEKTDINGNEYTFSVKEVDINGNSFTPPNFNKAESGLTVTNTYVRPVRLIVVEKEWVGGAEPRPQIWLQLYRRIAGSNDPWEPYTDKLDDRQTILPGDRSLTYGDLPYTDYYGNLYEHKVEEFFDTAGTQLTYPNYAKTITGLKITNTYVPPKNGTVTGTKVWVNGSAPRPTVWFKLFRQVEGGSLVPVPETEAPLKTLLDGTTSVTWTNLTETDLQGRPFNFTVREVNEAGQEVAPENYQPSVSSDYRTITNTYQIPSADAITAKKIWVNGPLNRPTIWFRLYRNLSGGTVEPVPGAEIKMLTNGTLEVTWTNIQKTDINGKPYTFTVREVDAAGNNYKPADFSKQEAGLTVTNTYVIPKTARATATKTWVNGSTPRPTTWFQLYRNTSGSAPEIVPGAEIKALAPGILSVDWTGLESTDINGETYIFTVKETDSAGNDAVPANYEKREVGLAVTNTYVAPANGTAEAQKTWVNGPDTKPDIWLQLYRSAGGETPRAVPTDQAPIKRLRFPETTASWANLTETDLNGRPYTFTIVELNTDAVDAPPPNYQKVENGLNVTNTYVIPTDGTATGNVIWVDGPRIKPMVWLKLYRVLEGGTREEVPGAGLMQLESGTTSVTWTGLEKTDINGKPYTFSVQEVDGTGADLTPENYRKSESGMTVTNIYVVPRKILQVTKVWEGGPEPKPTVWIMLKRRIENGEWENIETGVEKIVPGQTSYMYGTLPATDINGNPYIHTVEEVNQDGTPITLPNYQIAVDGLQITNTYVIPKNGSVTATKVWDGGSEPRPTIGFRLQRQSLMVPKQFVPNVPWLKLEPGTTSVTWEGLEETDFNGNPYTFSIVELNELGGEGVPLNYTALLSADGLTMTNHYEPPQDGEVTAQVIWVNGPAVNPTVWFKLQRSQVDTDGNVTLLEDVPDITLKELPNGTTNAKWTGLETTCQNGRPFIFSVVQVDQNGNDLTPPNFIKEELGLTVINTFQIPTNGAAAAKKIWVNGPAIAPTIWFKLQRTIPGGQPEDVPEAELYRLIDGFEDASWTGLDETDIDANVYTFSVVETDGTGQASVPPNYRMTKKGMEITNEYVVPTKGSAAANVVWVNRPDTRPTVWLKLYRQTDGGQLEEVPELPIRQLDNGQLTAGWDNLAETDISGNPYTFFVKEVNSLGVDWTPAQYTKDETNLTVTNTFVVSKDAKATGIKSWVKGLASDRPTVWFKLYRQIEGGTVEAVPDVLVKELPNGTTSVSWENLEASDLAGNTYIFTVRETDAAGNDFVPENYTKRENNLTVTNSYKIPTATVTGTKVWNNGPEPRPSVWFKLQRSIGADTPEDVPVELTELIKELPDGTLSVSWNDIEMTDLDGNPYRFTIKELDKGGGDLAPIDYIKDEDGLTVTNSYNIPKSGEATGTLTWVNGPDEPPTVWFMLYRELPNGTAVPVPGVDLIELPAGTTAAHWTNLEQCDLRGNFYTFSVRQVDAAGNPLTLPEYDKEEVGLNVTNTYRIPMDSEAVANLIWEGGTTPRPTVWFKLYREIEGGSVEAVPDAETQMLVDGVLSVSWTNLAGTDLAGMPYTFSVRQIDEAGNGFTPDGYVKLEEGLTVKNSQFQPRILVQKELDNWESQDVFDFVFARRVNNKLTDKVNFKVAAGTEPYILPDLEIGAEYVVTEQLSDLWRQVSAVCVSSLPGKTQSPYRLVLEKNESVTCTFVNSVLFVVDPDSVLIPETGFSDKN